MGFRRENEQDEACDVGTPSAKAVCLSSVDGVEKFSAQWVISGFLADVFMHIILEHLFVLCKYSAIDRRQHFLSFGFRGPRAVPRENEGR